VQFPGKHCHVQTDFVKQREPTPELEVLEREIDSLQEVKLAQLKLQEPQN
jgi:hypothetical protein